MGYFEWEKKDVERIINSAIKEGRVSVTLDMHKNTYYNEEQIVQWIEELGYDATHDIERIVVTLKKIG